MLSFLNSIVLPVLMAAVIPLIIHFFNRRKTKKITFSSIRFLKLLENQRIKQVRLYQILLILIRALFIIFLVLAFSRPTLKDAVFGGSSSARTTAVIILDDSFSMQAYVKSDSRYNLACGYIKKVLSTFKAEDQIFILSPSMDYENIMPVNLNSANFDFLKKYPVTCKSPGFSYILKKADGLFNQYPNHNRELFILSDFQINRLALNDSISSYFKDQSIRSYLIDVTNQHTFNNIAIDTVIVQNRIFELNKPITLLARLQNYNLSESAETLVNLFLSDKRLAMEQASLPPGGIMDIQLSFIPKQAGQRLLHLELDDDDLTIDNFYYLNLNIPEKLNVLFVDDNPSFHLKTALNVLSTNTVFEIEQSDYSRWYGKNFKKYNLIVLSNPRLFTNETINRLSLFLDSGKNVFIIPGAALAPKQINNLFRPLIKSNIYLNYKQTSNPENYFAFSDISAKHPIFKPLFSAEGINAEPPKIFKYLKINPSAQTLLRLRNGDSFLSRFSPKNLSGDIYAFGSMLDLEWTDFPIKGLFIPALYRIFYIAGQNRKHSKSALVNESYSIFLPDLSLKDKYRAKRPGGDKYEIIPDQSKLGLRFLFNELTKPGHYLLYQNDKIIQSFPVNVSSKELKRPYVRFENISENVVNLNLDSDFIKQIKQARSGQELWYIFLSLAFLFLLLEILLIKKIEGKGKIIRN